MKRVLLPTDFSENAWNATLFALERFRDRPCVFYLLNTYTPSFAGSRFLAGSFRNDLDNGAKCQSEQGLELWLARILGVDNQPHHRFETISSFSLLVDEVREVVIEHGIQLIVTGTKGASGLEEVFLGSNTVRMIKTVSECPVLAIPSTFRFRRTSQVAFATHLDRYYDPVELRPISDWVKAYGARLHIVCALKEGLQLTSRQQQNLRLLHDYFGQQIEKVHCIPIQESISKTLEDFTLKIGIDVLAMLHYQHSIIEKLTREPVVKRVAFHIQVPLLVIPELGLAEQNDSDRWGNVAMGNGTWGD